MTELKRFPKHAGYLGIGLQAAMGTGVAPTHFVKWSGAPTITPGQDFTRYNEGGDSQYPGMVVKHLHRSDGNFDCFARPNVAAMLVGLLLGKQVSKGTPDGDGADTTLEAIASVGATMLDVVSTAGFEVGDIIEIGAEGSEEVREITDITGAEDHEITINNPLAREHAIGAAVEGVALPITHKFTPAEVGSMPWASLERSIAGELVSRFVDVRIQQINISGEAGQPITMTVNYLGVTEEGQASPQTAVYEVNEPFIFWQGTYTVDGEDESANVTNFNIQLINVFDEVDQASEVFRSHIPLIRREIEVSWGMKFEDESRYVDTYLGGGTEPGEGVAKSTGALIIDLSYGIGTDVRGLEIEIPAIWHTAAPVELDAGSTDSQAYACEGFARKDPAQELVEVTIKNAEAEKYA